MTDKGTRSNQFLFYLMPEETVQAIERIVEAGNVAVLGSRSATDSPSVIMSYSDMGQFFLCPKSELSEVVMNKTDSEVYFLDPTVSPVVEFNGCILREHELSRGRIYCRFGYEGRNGWIAFPESTATVYTRMVDYLKSTFLTKERKYDGYISRKTKEYLNSGGNLVQF